MSVITFPSDADRVAILRRARFWQEHPTLTEQETLLLVAFRRLSPTQQHFVWCACEAPASPAPAVAPAKIETPSEGCKREARERVEAIRARYHPSPDTPLEKVLGKPALVRLRAAGPAQTLADMAQWTKDDLTRVPYVGGHTWWTLTPWLAAAGLTFRPKPEEAQGA